MIGQIYVSWNFIKSQKFTPIHFDPRPKQKQNLKY